MNTSTTIVAVLVMTAGAAAQPNLVFNGDFETPDSTGTQPQGWAPFNSARYRTVGDGLGEILVRSGTHSVELASGTFTFVGYTTDVFNPSTLHYYNPPYVYQGGQVTVTGYYAIPADQPLVGTMAGMKLEFRRDNSSIYQAFETLSISGHTNGQWVPFVMTVYSAQINPSFPPFATSVSVLPERFGDVSSTGTIFWDDISFVQCNANCDESTVAPALNVADFTCFLQRFAAGDPYANCDRSTTPPVLNVADFTCFLQAYAAGCQ
jgi:hypothetical protein